MRTTASVRCLLISSNRMSVTDFNEIIDVFVNTDELPVSFNNVSVIIQADYNNVTAIQFSYSIHTVDSGL